MKDPTLPQAKGEPAQAFSHVIEVLPQEIDELGHVSNVGYLQWVQDVARDHTDTLGYTIPRYYEIGGIFVVQRHEIEYAAMSFQGDRLRVVTWVDDWTPYYCHRYTTSLRLSDGAVAARAKTTWVWVSVPEGKPRRIPAEIRAAFSAPADPAVQDRFWELRDTGRVPMTRPTAPR